MSVLALDTASPVPPCAVLAGGRLFEEALPADRPRLGGSASRDRARLRRGAREPLRGASASRSARAPARSPACASGSRRPGAWAARSGIPVEAVSTLEALAEAARPSGRAASRRSRRGPGRARRRALRPLGSRARARSLAPARVPRGGRGRLAAGRPIARAAARTSSSRPAAPPASLAAALALAVARAPRDGLGRAVGDLLAAERRGGEAWRSVSPRRRRTGCVPAAPFDLDEVARIEAESFPVPWKQRVLRERARRAAPLHPRARPRRRRRSRASGATSSRSRSTRNSTSTRSRPTRACATAATGGCCSRTRIARARTMGSAADHARGPRRQRRGPPVLPLLRIHARPTAGGPTTRTARTPSPWSCRSAAARHSAPDRRDGRLKASRRGTRLGPWPFRSPVNFTQYKKQGGLTRWNTGTERNWPSPIRSFAACTRSTAPRGTAPAAGGQVPPLRRRGNRREAPQEGEARPERSHGSDRPNTTARGSPTEDPARPGGLGLHRSGARRRPLLAARRALARRAAFFYAAPLFLLQFFRDPERVAARAAKTRSSPPPTGRCSPIAEAPEAPPGARRRLSIFMSVFNCHVNRAPVDGRLCRLRLRARPQGGGLRRQGLHRERAEPDHARGRARQP